MGACLAASCGTCNSAPGREGLLAVEYPHTSRYEQLPPELVRNGRVYRLLHSNLITPELAAARRLALAHGIEWAEEACRPARWATYSITAQHACAECDRPIGLRPGKCGRCGVGECDGWYD
jgi:hypothetical protein